MADFTALRFDVDAADADRWSDALLDAGAMSVEAVDPRAGSAQETAIFAEPANTPPRWWPVSRLTALCERGADAARMLRSAAASIGAVSPAFETFHVPEQDWVRATQAQFRPIRIGDDFWIVPSWCEPPNEAALNLTLDPGLAFGTGAHATTRLCLQWLRETVTPGASVLDYGCGSGILAIAAAKLGAMRVVGIDIDPQAVHASTGNARENGVRAPFMLPDELGAERFGIVVANILANPLRLLAPVLAARADPRGMVALSGILATQANEVAAAYAPWFDMERWREDEDWVLLAGVRRSDDGRA